MFRRVVQIALHVPLGAELGTLHAGGVTDLGRRQYCLQEKLVETVERLSGRQVPGVVLEVLAEELDAVDVAERPLDERNRLVQLLDLLRGEVAETAVREVLQLAEQCDARLERAVEASVDGFRRRVLGHDVPFGVGIPRLRSCCTTVCHRTAPQPRQQRAFKVLRRSPPRLNLSIIA